MARCKFPRPEGTPELMAVFKPQKQNPKKISNRPGIFRKKTDQQISNHSFISKNK